MIQERFVAYSPGTDTRLGLLPQPTSHSTAYVHNNVGALTLDYSSLAAGGDLISQNLKNGLDIAVEWNVVGGANDWFEPFGSRFLLIRRNCDLADPSKLVTLTCPSYGWLMNKVRMLDTAHLEGSRSKHAGQRKMANADTGSIIKTMLDEHQARRGQGVPLLRDSWTDTKDSDGVNWVKKKTWYLDLGDDLLTILQGQVDSGHCDWRTQGRGLRIYNPDTHFSDRSSVVQLRVGKEVQSAPIEESLEDTVTHILVKGDKKIKVTVQNVDGPTPWGHWEGCINEGGLDTTSEASDAAQKQLSESSRVRGQYTYTLALADTTVQPLFDYVPGDWVKATTPLGTETVRVQQITMSRDGEGLKADVILNDRFTDAALKLANKIGSLSNATSTGGTGASPDTDDPTDYRQAEAPTGFSITPSLYLTTSKRWAVRLVFDWNDVTTATDGTDLEIGSYTVWGTSGLTAAQVAYTPAGTTAVSLDGFVPGSTWTFSVNAQGVTTTQPGAMATPITLTLPTDATPPPKPSAPALESSASIITASWDGKADGGGAMPEDLARVEVLGGTANPPTAVIGTLNSAGVWTGYVEAGQTVYVAFRAVDYAGNVSVLSSVSATVVMSILDDPDLTALLGTKARIYMQDAEPVAPIPAGSWWFTATGQTRLFFTAAGAATGSATWVPYQFDASQILTAGTILADNIGVNQIVNKHMASHSIDVDVLTGGLLQAEITLSGLIKTAETGARVVMDSASGLVLYNSEGDEVIAIRTDGTSRFNGKITASELTVDGIMSLNVAGNLMNPGSSLLLSAGIQAPTISPSASVNYASIQLKNADGSNFTSVACVTRDAAGYWYAAQIGSRQVHRFNASGTYNSLYGAIPSAVTLDNRYQFTCVSDLTWLGGSLYALMSVSWRPTTVVYQVWDLTSDTLVISSIGAVNGQKGYSSPGGRTATVTGGDSPSNTLTYPAFQYRLMNDGTNFVIAYLNSTSGKEEYQTISTGGAVVSTKTNATQWTAGQYVPWAAAVGSFDLGAKNYLCTIPSALTGVAVSYARHTLDSSQANNANVTWPVAADATVAVEWASAAYASLPGGPTAACFWTADANGVVYTHDGPTWTNDALLTRNYDFAFTYYNPSPYQSKISPRTTFAVRKRSRTRVAVSGWVPGVPDADVTQLRFYAATPAGTLWAQATVADQAATLVSFVTTGSNPPTATSFPTSIPAMIGNTDGTLVISADGTIKQLQVGAKMTKSTTGHNAAGSAYSANTWTRISGFNVTDLAQGVTVDASGGAFTAQKEDEYDLGLKVRWQSYGTAYSRSAAIVKGTSAPATDGSNVIEQLTWEQSGWLISQVVVLGCPLAVGDVVSFWIRSGAGATMNATNTAIPGWTHAEMFKR